jgi:GT2 family glycosyltransferase
MLDFMDANERCGAVVPRVLNPDGSVQPIVSGLPGMATPLFSALQRWFPDCQELARCEARGFDYSREDDVEAAALVCFLVRRKALRRSQQLDEGLPLFFCDTDLCKRLRDLSWRIRYLPQVQIFHHGGRSLALLPDAVEQWQRARVAYYRKHHGRLGGDWIKLCAGLAFADQLIGELWRRAHGLDETPLRPAYEMLAGCLRS